MGRAGAETALIALLNNMDIKKYDIYLYVVLNQGEMVKELPSYVKLLNKHYCKESVLSSKGKKVLIRGIFKKMFLHGAVFKNILYINYLRFFKNIFKSVFPNATITKAL